MTTPLTLEVTDSNRAPLGEITVRDLTEFNRLCGTLSGVLNAPAQGRPAAYRAAAQELGITIPKTARPKTLSNPNLSIWLIPPHG